MKDKTDEEILINRNMRCIEILASISVPINPPEINRNMRCIEIKVTELMSVEGED